MGWGGVGVDWNGGGHGVGVVVLGVVVVGGGGEDGLASGNACMWQHTCGSMCMVACVWGGSQGQWMCVWARGRWGRWDMIWGSKVMGAWGCDQIIVIKRLGMNNYDQ